MLRKIPFTDGFRPLARKIFEFPMGYGIINRKKTYKQGEFIMKNFLSGRADKMGLVLVIFFIPMIIFSILGIDDSYHISEMIGIGICLLYIKHLDKKERSDMFIFSFSDLSFKTVIFSCFTALAVSSIISLSYLKLGLRVDNTNIIKSIIAACIIAPVLEEVFFRFILSKVWFWNIEESERDKLKLALIGSFTWSIIHFRYLIDFFIHNIAIFLVGILLYYILFATKNVVYTLIMHVVLNLSQDALIFPMQKYIVKGIENNAVFISVICFLVLIAAVGSYKLLRSEKIGSYQEKADTV